MKKNKIDLPREIRIATAESLWKSVYKQEIEKKGVMEIDLKKVEILDGAGFQLILYLKYIAREIPEQFQIVNEQSTLTQLLADNGFSQ